MTKPKLMLLAGTLVLATAGAMASKVAHVQQTVWYSTGAGPVSTTTDAACSPGATGCTTTIDGQQGIQLYRTTDDSGQLLDPLRADE